MQINRQTYRAFRDVSAEAFSLRFGEEIRLAHLCNYATCNSMLLPRAFIASAMESIFVTVCRSSRRVIS